MNFKPTASEIANIWKFIISNQAHLCFLKQWEAHAEDEDLKEVLKQSKDIALQIVTQGLELFQNAGFPPPIGFSIEKDHVQASKLMSDKAALNILQILSE